MNAELFGVLFYGGIALVMALIVVLTQVLVMDFESRFGRWLVVLIPPIVILGIMLTSAFSGRNLQFSLRDPSVGSGGEVVWVTRMMSVLLLAMAFARLFAYWNRQSRRLANLGEAAVDGAPKLLFITFVAYVFAAVVCPMFFSANPRPTYKGLIALMCFAAVYVSRGEGPGRLVASARWSLLVLMVGSLAAAAVSPNLALQPDYGGGLPVLKSRLWGLAYHANGMGALALLLLLLQFLQPSKARWVNWTMWLAGLAVLLLAQSKTVWLAGGVAVLLISAYQYGRSGDGRPRLGMVFLGLALPGLAALGLLLVGPADLFDKIAKVTATTGAGTLTGRTEIWAAAIEMWQDSPIFGNGLDAWELKNRLALGLPAAVHAHNQLFQALSTGGLVSATGLLVFFFALCVAAFRHAATTRGVSLALLAMLTIRCLSEPPLEIGSMLSGEILTLLVLFTLCIQPRPTLQKRRSAPVGVPVFG